VNAVGPDPSISVNVFYVPRKRKLRLAGEADDRVVDVLEQATLASLGFRSEGSGIVWFSSDDETSHEWMASHLPPEITMRDLAEFFEEEIRADPPTIRIVPPGGGWDWDALFTFVGQVGTAAGAVKGSLTVQRALLRVRYRAARSATLAWLDDGHIEPELKDFVLAHHYWPRRRFDEVLELPRREGTRLLKHLGYKMHNSQFGEEWWRVDEDPYESRF
jgi:hypothetical protein